MPQSRIQNVACIICQNTENNHAFTAREMMFGFRDEFTYFECSKCGCVQIKEVPANLSKYYPPNYYSFQKTGALKTFLKKRLADYSYSDRGALGWLLSKVLGNNKAVESVSRAGVSRDAAILDIGCGSGALLLLLHTLGFTDVTGADPFIAKDLVHDNGIEIWKKELSEIPRSFDVIMSHHSFEHMTNPVEIMTHAQRILKPGGLLIIRVPIAGSFAWKTYGANWIQLDPPRHIFLPSVQSMKVLAEQTGFEFGEVIYESDEFQFWGSEQYALDIPLLHDSRSGAPLWKKIKYRMRAAELNAKGEGDTACFNFRKKVDASKLLDIVMS